MATLCNECRHVRLNYKSDPPTRWYCIQHPRLAAFGFVTNRLLNWPPFLYCREVNGGACPLFEAGDNQTTQMKDQEYTE